MNNRGCLPALPRAALSSFVTLVGVMVGPSAWTQTLTATASSSVAAAAPVKPQARPSAPAAAVQNLASPVGIPVEPSTDWQDKLRYSFVLLSTARWQTDNGNITTLADNNWNPTGENFGDIVTTIGGSVGYEQWLLAARFDTAFYVHRPQPHPTASALVKSELQDRYINQVRPEYVALSYSGRSNSFTLGDYYMTLGRGMILSIRKVGDVGVDNKLFGARAESRVKVGGGELKLTEFGGWVNSKNYESGTGYYYPERPLDARDPNRRFYDAMDFVAGGRAEYRMGKYLKVGAHAARINSSDDELGDSQVVNGFGANVELPRPVKWLSFYAEVARLLRDDTRRATEDQPTEEGWGLYTNTNLYFGDTTVLVEGKYYDNMFNVFPRGLRQPRRQVLNRLIEAPTAERPQTLLLANNTVYGGRVRVDHRALPGLVPYLATGLYRDNSFGREADGTVIETSPPTSIVAVYGGGRLTKSWAEIMLEVGYRTQRNQFREDRKQASANVAEDVALLSRDLDGSIFRDDLHVTFDWRQPVWGPISLELSVNYLNAKQESARVDCRLPQLSPETAEKCDARPADKSFVAIPESWHEGRVALSVIAKQGWSLTGAWEFYTRQPTQYKENYFSVGGQYEFMKGGIVRALYGGERAGLKCSGGVCRFFPGFEGGRIELNMRL